MVKNRDNFPMRAPFAGSRRAPRNMDNLYMKELENAKRIYMLSKLSSMLTGHGCPNGNSHFHPNHKIRAPFWQNNMRMETFCFRKF